MFENLSERLERSFKILKGEGRITEINVAETLKDVRRALLDAPRHSPTPSSRRHWDRTCWQPSNPAS